MRAFLGKLDRWTIVAVVAGAALGALWLVNLAPAASLTGVAAPLGALAFLIARRWVEAGAFLGSIGLVPTVAYRIGGPPALPSPLPENGTPIEALAPGGAYVLLLVGIAVVAITAFSQLRSGRRREEQERRHRERRPSSS